MVKKYKDEEGITLELDGLGAREIKAAIIKRDEKETEEALSELVSHRNVAVVLVKPPLSGDARVVRKIHEHLEDTLRFDVVLTMVSGDRVNGWSEEDRKDAETLCGGVGVCSRPKPPKKKAEAKEVKEAKEGDVAKGTKNKTDNKGTAGKGGAKEGHEGVTFDSSAMRSSLEVRQFSISDSLSVWRLPASLARFIFSGNLSALSSHPNECSSSCRTSLLLA